MGLLDRVKHTAVQTVNARVFTLSAAANFESIPNNSTEIPVVIADDAGNHVICEASYVAPTLTVDVVESGSAGKAVPNFTGNIEVFVALGAKALNRQRKGVAGVGYAGQSNAVGVAAGNDPLIEMDDPRVTQMKYEFDPADPRGTNYDPYEVLLHREPAYFKELSGHGSSNVGSHGHFLRWLANNGRNNVRLIPGAEGSSAFGTAPDALGGANKSNLWRAGDPLAVRFKDMIVTFINESEDNYMEAVVWMHGETDSYTGAAMTEATYASHFDTFWSWLIAQVKLETTRAYDMDAEGVPLIVVGMPQQYVTGGNYAGTVQDALIDTPNRISWSAFVDMSAYTNADPLHHSAATQRILGKELLPAALAEARKNYPASPNITGSLNYTEEADTLTASVTLTGSVTGSLNYTEEDDTLTATSTVGAGSSTPDTDALAPLVHLFKGVGVNTTGSAVDSWEDQSGNGNTPTQTLVDQKPVWDGTSIVFDSTPYQTPNVTDGLAFANNVFNIVDKWTLIIDYTFDAAANNYVLFGGTGILFNGNASGGTIRVRATTHGNNDLTLPATATDGNRHRIEVIVDVTGNTIEGRMDGTQFDLITNPSWVDSPDGSNSGLGFNGASTTFGADAKIDYFMVFDKALTPTQLSDVAAEHP